MGDSAQRVERKEAEEKKKATRRSQASLPVRRVLASETVLK